MSFTRTGSLPKGILNIFRFLIILCFLLLDQTRCRGFTTSHTVAYSRSRLPSIRCFWCKYRAALIAHCQFTLDTFVFCLCVADRAFRSHEWPNNDATAFLRTFSLLKPFSCAQSCTQSIDQFKALVYSIQVCQRVVEYRSSRPDRRNVIHKTKHTRRLNGAENNNEKVLVQSSVIVLTAY